MHRRFAIFLNQCLYLLASRSCISSQWAASFSLCFVLLTLTKRIVDCCHSTYQWTIYRSKKAGEEKEKKE